MFLWLKLGHVFFVVAWFAGLFYLPRLFVNLAMVRPDSAEYARLLLMARKLFRFMTPWGVGAVLLGLSMPLFHIGFAGWVWVKVVAAVLLAVYHVYCGRLLADFAAGRNRRSDKWFRVFNELPVLVLLAALYAVVFKPF